MWGHRRIATLKAGCINVITERIENGRSALIDIVIIALAPTIAGAEGYSRRSHGLGEATN